MSQIFLYILNEMAACSFFSHLLAAIASQMQMVLKAIVEIISVDKCWSSVSTVFGPFFLDEKTVHFKT